MASKHFPSRRPDSNATSNNKGTASVYCCRKNVLELLKIMVWAEDPFSSHFSCSPGNTCLVVYWSCSHLWGANHSHKNVQYLSGRIWQKGSIKMSRLSHTEIWAVCKDFKLKEGRFRLDIRMIYLQWGWWNSGTGCQRGGRCSIPGNNHGQVGWDSEQPILVEDVPTHWWEGLDRWTLKVLSNPKYSIILRIQSCMSATHEKHRHQKVSV